AALPAGESADTVRKAWDASGEDPAKLVGVLLDDEQGIAGLAALLGAVADVDARVTQLEGRADPAAAPVSSAWEQGTGAGAARVVDFLHRLERPSLLTGAAAGVAGIRGRLDDLQVAYPHLGKSVAALWDRAGADLAEFRGEVEDWFDREMARVSGW